MVATFDRWRGTCSDPGTAAHDEQRQTAALLLDEKTLNRLIRYETHANRSFQRALENLARLRGVAVETVMARVTHQQENGTTVEVQGQHTRWGKMDGSRRGCFLRNEARLTSLLIEGRQFKLPPSPAHWLAILDL